MKTLNKPQAHFLPASLFTHGGLIVADYDGDTATVDLLAAEMVQRIAAITQVEEENNISFRDSTSRKLWHLSSLCPEALSCNDLQGN